MENKIIAFEIARYFLVHILSELNKAPDLIDNAKFDGRSSREINTQILKKLYRNFPELKEIPPPTVNIFREWVALNKFQYKYEEFSFEAYNLIFYERIVNIKNWSEESIRIFHNRTIQIFNKYDTSQAGFSISFFMRAENNMRELLRNIFNKIPSLNKEAVWELIFEQSKQYQEVVNEFFEKLLKNALNQSERLLHNILPISVSNELKVKGKVQPLYITSATVLFTDFKGFTKLTEELVPSELMARLDECFSVFDRIMEDYNLEKIKTIGDSYMCAGGVPAINKTNPVDAALAALNIRENMLRLKKKFCRQHIPFWDVRIGFHTGPLIAGVIGKKKFSYDIWGDTVNTASRMESSGEAGKINISEKTYEKIEFLFDCEPRGMVEAKGKGKLRMYFLKRIKKEFSKNGTGTKPNEKFFEIYEKIKSGTLSN